MDPKRKKKYHIPNGRSLSMYARAARIAYTFFVWVFLACVVVQVFLAGLAIFVIPADWRLHTRFIHFFQYLPLVMLILSFVGRLPSGLRWLSGGLCSLILVQYTTAHQTGTAIAAIHPVSAMVIFWGAVVAARRATRQAFGATTTAS